MVNEEKIGKRRMHYPERIIHSSNNIPEDLDYNFKRFIQELTSNQNPFIGGATIEISEPRSSEEFSTILEFKGLTNMTLQFKIRYIVNPPIIDLGYEVNTSYQVRMPKFGMNKSEKQLSDILIPYIINAFNKSFEAEVEETNDPLKLLKLKFVEGEISEEEYLHKKKLLED